MTNFRQPIKKEIVRGMISIFAGLALWEFLPRWLLESELLIPPPTSVMRSFWRLSASGELYKHFEVTLMRLAGVKP